MTKKDGRSLQLPDGSEEVEDMGEAVSKDELNAKLDKEFEAWRHTFSSTMVGVPQAKGDMLRTFEFRCEHPVKRKNTEGAQVCGHLIRYVMCGEQVRPYIPPDAGVFGALGMRGFGDSMAEAMSPVLFKRIKPYLFKNGFVFCEDCGAIYRVVAGPKEAEEEPTL